jgi:hypothetical protein
MENGVSGCRVGRACRNDNEDSALGERASGRTSSSAHRGEPIIAMAKAPHRNSKMAAVWSDKSVSQRAVWILAPTMFIGVCYLPSAVAINVIINDSSPALFANRPPSTAVCMMNLVQQPVAFSPSFSIVATFIKHWPTPIVDHTKAKASTLKGYEVEYRQQRHAPPPSKPSLPTSGGRSGRKSPRGGNRSPAHHRLLQVPSASVYGTECAPEGPLSPTVNLTTTALPTTHLSLHAPNFDMQPSLSSHSCTPPLSTTPLSSTLASSPSRPHHTQSAPTPSASSSSKGQIHVKLISARGLHISSIKSRPYVIVVFEDNEFVSRDPTDEGDKEVRGVATNLSRTSSSVAISALGAVGSKAAVLAAAQEAASRTRRPSPVSSSSSNSAKSSLSVPGVSGTRTPSNGLLRCRSAHSPVWKHEVSLYVASYRGQVPSMTSFLTVPFTAT